MRPRILLLDTIADKGVRQIMEFADLTDGRAYSAMQISQEIGEFDGLVIKSNNRISAELIQQATNLRVIGRAGSGVDNIDMIAAAERNITVITSPEGNVCSVAEYVLCMIILLGHKFSASHEGSRRNDFRRHTWQGRNMENLTVGIIGLGNIGKGVVRKIAPLSKTVLGYDPYIGDQQMVSQENFIRVKDINEIYKNADVISLHLPLNGKTLHMINKEIFSIIKKNCILINTSRGQLIDDIALLEALKDGTVESAALDTLYPDPEYNKLPEDSTYSHFLIHHPKVYYTPHIAAGSRDALEDVAEALAKKMRTFFGIDQTTFR